MSFIHRTGDKPDDPVFLVFTTTNAEIERGPFIQEELNRLLADMTKDANYDLGIWSCPKRFANAFIKLPKD